MPIEYFSRSPEAFNFGIELPQKFNSAHGRRIVTGRYSSLGRFQFLVMLRSAMLHPAQQWLYSDPCRSRSFSSARFVLMATLFLCMTVGSLPLFLLLIKRPYGFQAASAIAYTIFAIFFTFAHSRGMPPYMFTCPAVQPQLSRLFRRHLCFVVALFALQTVALAMRPHLPDWWNTATGRGRGGGPPFDLALTFLCAGLGFTQVLTNRSLLDRAHRESQ